MLYPSRNSVEWFGISRRNGFLPNESPLHCLPSPYYKPWELIVQDLPALIRTRRLRKEVESLSILSCTRLISEMEWQRAYVLLSFLTNAYIWGGDRPSEILPAAISCPFLEVSEHLGLPPVATYAGLNLWNFSPLLPDCDLCEPENLVSLHTFTGTRDEEWFYAISVAMEARGGAIIPVMLSGKNAADVGDSIAVSACLVALSDCLRDLGVLLGRMYEKCSPDVFYHEIRPILAGSKNMAVAGLPRGIFYDEGEGKGQWRQYSGGSNAQSSLIQFFDIILGIKHRASGEMTCKKNAFMQEMRKYMPKTHRDFLEQLSHVTIHEYVMKHDATHPIVEDYNSAVAMLTAFRNIHLQIVTRYIILPSKTGSSRRRQDRVFNLAVGSTLKTSMDPGSPSLQGTGGTQLIPFLKQTRDETKDAAIFHV